MDVKEAAILGEDAGQHWYYTSKGRALLQLLKGLRVETVLDIGAGSGIFSRQLLEAGVCRRAVCVDPAYDAERIEQHHGQEIRFSRTADQGPADIVLMMDVLEHVDDDTGLLAHTTKDLRPQDLVVITVPAFQVLWSGHDEFLDHRRRYTRQQIEAVVRAAGLVPVKSGYFFSLLFPVAAVQRLFNKWRRKFIAGEAKSALGPQGKTVNTVLIGLHDLERKMGFPLNRMAGLTAFCLARRPQ